MAYHIIFCAVSDDTDPAECWLLMLRRRHNHAIRFCGDDKDDVCSNCSVGGWKLSFLQKTGANFCQRLLRPKVLFADDEDDAIHKSKGVFEHELLQFAIVGSAPEFALQKRPSHLYLTIR